MSNLTFKAEFARMTPPRQKIRKGKDESNLNGKTYKDYQIKNEAFTFCCLQ